MATSPEEFKKWTSDIHLTFFNIKTDHPDNYKLSVEAKDHARRVEYLLTYTNDKGQAFSHCFSADYTSWARRAATDRVINWERVNQILDNHNLAIGPYEDIVIWDLLNLDNQDKPRARCSICGKSVEET